MPRSISGEGKIASPLSLIWIATQRAEASSPAWLLLTRAMCFCGRKKLSMVQYRAVVAPWPVSVFAALSSIAAKTGRLASASTQLRG